MLSAPATAQEAEHTEAEQPDAAGFGHGLEVQHGVAMAIGTRGEETVGIGGVGDLGEVGAAGIGRR